ncbi:hypothetical protein, partial [Mycobacterium tuberculosis]|uniref:hypothetical protein n=1 Tax=Mycobacterium tuberculosis TaxID=1773 RepID=UPI00254D9B81
RGHVCRRARNSKDCASDAATAPTCAVPKAFLAANAEDFAADASAPRNVDITFLDAASVIIIIIIIYFLFKISLNTERIGF